MFAKNYDTEIKIDYNNVDGFKRYPSDIMAEYNQYVEDDVDCIDDCWKKPLIKR